ncbi:iduronate 2-sulfatase [Neorhodopirellula lusitana]|uniref:Iduronate 2-sulfatase n=1 Tax=Neorhodopirellula lusitana TaxID=445327 RepID=A0ABY1QRE0_9BACT|nr:sulfatase [Neorhodopirellula lusitana]SMP78279.1 iduronate 2-sulfatase [Neorhodopirellula lusitana]
MKHSIPTVCILALSVVAVLFASPVVAQAEVTTTPNATKNVLVFFVDDLRPELGCYGVEAMHSPSIDALASEGLLFEHAYCQQALCAPSRISMMTGQYPDRTGICDLFTPLRKVNKTAMTLPLYFQQRGYVTASFGKVYHHRRDDQTSWSEIPTPPSAKYADPVTLAAIDERVKDAKAQKLDVDQTRLAAKGPPTECFEIDDEGYRDGVVARQAIESLRRNQDKPFFMCVGFAKPHLPFAAPKRYWDLYERDQFQIPSRQRPDGSPDLAFTVWGELRAYHGIPQDGELSDEMTRELMHGYAASVSFADAQVGKVMAELDRLHLRDDTLVVLWGDHGFKLGEYGLWCKHTNFELDAHVPLIISAPGNMSGKRTDALVEIVDLFPTLASMTGGEVPESCDGKSLRPLLRNPDQNFKPYALTQYPRGSTMGYSLRNDRYRYTEWIQAGTKRVVARELYDHRDTKTPESNLASSPEHKDRISRLSQQLDAARRIENTNVNRKK